MMRIVCLSAETVDILVRLGAGGEIVGISTYATPPAGLEAPVVCGFNSMNLGAIRKLEPDLILAYSDVQADLAAQLIREGFNVLTTNQRSLEEIAATMELLGRVACRAEAGKKLAEDFRRSLAECRNEEGPRPRVYFEEWNDPLISSIGWVSELIELAGGEDLFSPWRGHKKASERVVDPEEVLRLQPEIIFASWCGKRVEARKIAERPGWADIPAVREGRVFEIDSSKILQPGLAILEGLQEMRRHIAAWRAERMVAA